MVILRWGLEWYVVAFDFSWEIKVVELVVVESSLLEIDETDAFIADFIVVIELRWYIFTGY